MPTKTAKTNRSLRNGVHSTSKPTAKRPARRVADSQEHKRQAAVHAARGMFKNMPGSLDEFLEEKHAETLRESRKNNF